MPLRLYAVLSAQVLCQALTCLGKEAVVKYHFDTAN